VTPITGDFRDYSNAPKKSFWFLEKRAVFIIGVKEGGGGRYFMGQVYMSSKVVRSEGLG